MVAWLLPSLILAALTAGLAQAQDADQSVSLSDVTSSVDEGGTIFFTVRREGATDSDLNVTVNIAPTFAINGFNLLEGGDAVDGADVTVTIPKDSSSEVGRIETIDNTIVNTDTNHRLVIQKTDGVRPGDDATAFVTVNNGDDVYALGVRIPPNHTVGRVSEGHTINVEFMRCVGHPGNDILQSCGDADRPRAGAVFPPPAVWFVEVETQGNYFAGGRLLETAEDITYIGQIDPTIKDAVRMVRGQFAKTYAIPTVNDGWDEADGSLIVRSRSNATATFRQVVVDIVDNDNTKLTIGPATAYGVVQNTINEGGSPQFKIRRYDTEQLGPVGLKVTLFYHDKILADDATRPAKIHNLSFAEDETSILFSPLETDNDELNEGDGRVLVNLGDESFKLKYPWNVTTQSAWIRVVDDDFPEVSLAVSDTSMTEGDTVEWHLGRSCCSEGNLGVRSERESVLFYPDHLWPDRITRGSATFFLRSIGAGLLKQVWSLPAMDVGPQGGYQRRRLSPFPMDTFTGIPTKSDHTFKPRYTIASSDWIRIDISNNAPAVEIETRTSPVKEGANVDFTIRRYGGAENIIKNFVSRVRINVAQKGKYLHTAELGDRTVTIPAGQTSVALRIPTINDSVALEDGEVTVTILSGAATDLAEDTYDVDERYSALARRYVYKSSVVIEDNDDLGVTVSPTSLTISEGASATYTVVLDLQPTASVTVTPSRSSGDTDVSVSVSEGPGLSLGGTDAAVSGALTFTTTNWNEAQTVTVSAEEDADADDDTAVIGHALAGGNYGSVDAADVAVTVDDDEEESTGVVLSVSPASVDEGDAATAITVTATLNGLARDTATQVAVSVGVSTGTGTAVSVTDFAAVDGFTITIPAGTVSHTGSFSLAPVQDALDEADESVSVSGTTTVADFTVSGAQVTLEDDDVRGVTISRTSLGVGEGGSGTYTVVLASRPTASVTVKPDRTSGDTGVTVSGELTFTATNWNQPQTVTVSAAEDADADDDTAKIEHSVSGADYGSVSAADVTVTVDDDEAVSTGVVLSVGPASVDEGADATTITVTATLNGLAHDKETPVAVTVGSGTATSVTDFVAVDAFTITIPGGTVSHTGTFSLVPVQDALDEADETVTVSGTATVVGFTVSGAQVTIADDDVRGVTISKTRLGIAEGSSGTYTVVLASQPTDSVAVTPSRRAGDTDVTVSGALTFATAGWNQPQTVTVSAAGDSGAVDDTAVIGHAVSGADYGSVSAADVAVRADDDEAVSTGVSLSVNPASVDEGDAATTITVTATLNGGTRPAATPVAVTVGSGTATSVTDFAAVDGFTITIPADAASHTGSFSLAPVQDTIDETDETVSVSGATTVSSLWVAGAQVTIEDDDEAASTGVSLSVSPDEVDEGDAATAITVTATLNGGTRPAGTPVAVTVGSGTATSVTDFAAVDGFTITIPANAQSHTGSFSLAPVQDAIDEADETVSVSGNTSVADFTVSGAEVTLSDDDTRGVTLSRTRLGIAEGDSGTYTVVLASEPTASVTVTPSRRAGDTDVTVSEALTFTTANWNQAQTVTVSADEDEDEDEDTATIGHAVSGGDYGSVSAANVAVTVDDDEAVSTGVVLSVSPDEVDEDDAATTITVTATLNGLAHDKETPVAVTVGSGTATSVTDFAAVDGFTITIPGDAKSHTGSFSLAPVQDAIDEADETVSVSGTTTVADFAVSGAEVTIEDDDDAPAAVLTLSHASIGEDGGVSTVTATLGHASGAATTVTVSVAPVTPAVAGDYAVSANEVLTIAAGATSSSGTVTVTGVDNDVDAADRTVTVSGTASNAVGVTDPADVVLTLTDDEVRGVTLSRTRLGIAEGGSGTYTVVLASEPTATVTVTPSRRSGDTDVTVSGALTFTTANWNEAQTVTVAAADDVDAVDDTAVIGHAVSGGDYGSVSAADVAVTVDDDAVSAGVVLSVSPDTVDEGDAATTITVTATLNRATRPAATPVAVTVGSGTATSVTDFAAVNGFTITIPADTVSHTGSFSLAPVQDAIDEADETVSVSGIPRPTATTDEASFAVSGAEVTIEDDDDAPAVTLTLSPASIGEDGGVSTVTATLGHASGAATTVTVSVAPVTPAVAGDYAVSANDVLTIAAGATSSTGAVTVTGENNDVDAADRTVTVSGTASNAVGVTGPADVVLTLTDDEVRGVTISRTRLGIAEDDSGTYTVVLASEPTATVTVTPSRSSGDTDVTVSGALTFTAANWNELQTVTVSAADDVDAVDDTAVIGHAVSGGDYGLVSAADVAVTVDDDEAVSTGVVLSVSPDAVDESDAATAITVTATLNGGTRSAATAVAVTVSSGTATSVTDFAAVDGFTITVPADTVSHTGSFSLAPVQDAIDEADETVSVSGIPLPTATTDEASFAVSGAEVTIEDDDDAPAVTLTLSPASIGEDGGVSTVTATLGHASGAATTVTVSVAPVTPAVAGDYAVSANKALRIAAGATASTGAVTVTGENNDVDAADRTVTVSGTASNAVGVTDPADVVLTLTDDDARGVTLSRTRLGIAEGGSGTYTVVLASEPTASVTVTPSRRSGDTDVTVSGALTFTTANWSEPQTVTVSAEEDADAVDDTAVIGHAVSGGDYGPVSAADVAVTVDDDEAVSTGVVLSVSPDTVDESDAATTITVSAALNGGTRPAATPVAVTVGSGTATSVTDFAAVDGFTITVPADTVSHTGSFSLAPVQDAIDEADETVSVSGTTTVADFAVSGAEVTIEDDDDAPAVTLTLSPASIGEDGGVSTVTATLGHASGAATTVTVSVAPVTPAVAGDYAVSANKALRIAAGATASTGAVTVTGENNDVDAADRTVTVSGTASNAVGVTDPADVVLTLTDDDARGVTLSRTRLGIAEGGSGTYTVVLASEPTASVTVTPSRRSGDTDVTVSGALTFTTANWSEPQTVTVSAEEDADAVDDTAVIGHAVSGGDYGPVSAADVAVTVDDDEAVSTGVVLSVSPDTVDESDAATTITVTATLNGGTRPAATAVAVTVGSGTATSVTDFAAVDGFTITIPADTVSHTGSFSLAPVQDAIDEADETVSVSGTTTVAGVSVSGAEVTIEDDDGAPAVTLALSHATIGEDGGVSTVTATLGHASGAATTVTVSVAPVTPAVAGDYAVSANKALRIAAGATASTGAVTVTGENNDVDAADRTVTVSGTASNAVGVTDPADVVLTLTDDDARGVTLSRTRLGIAEGGSGTYTVVLASEPTASVTVTPSRRSGDTDVTVSGALTFTTANWSEPQTVTVSAEEDADAVDDTAVIGHAVSGGDYGPVSAADVAVTVDDDEAVSTGVVLSVSPDTVDESDAATTITVSAALNGGTRPAATPVAVTVGSGTATSVTDFAAVDAFTITIPADTVSHTGSFSLAPVQDAIDEADETVSVSGTTTVADFAVSGADVTIEDDDGAPAVALTLSPASIGEDGGVSTVTATLGHASGAATTVTVSVAPVSPAVAGDYAVSANEVLTIAAGATSSSGTVTVTGVDNDVDAADRTVTVSGAASNAVGVTDPADVVLTLTDDDARGVTISRTRLGIAEDDSGTYTVVLASEPTATVTVTPSRSSGDTDVTVSGALTFTAANWNELQTVTVSAADDVDAVDDTAVIGHAVSGGDYGLVSAADVAVTVDDDEGSSRGFSTEVLLSVSPASVDESAAATAITVTATLNGGTRPAATPVAVTVGSGTAVSGTDFTAVDGFTITVPADAKSHTGSFSLAPVQDAIDEADETVSVSGTTTVAGVSVSGAEVTIEDDDEAPAVTLTLSHASIGEDGGVSTVTATLGHASGAATTVTVSVAPVSPAVAGDYAVSANKVLTIAAGARSSSGTVTVTGVDNDVDAADRTVTVSGAVSNGVGVTDPADAVLTLVDDDTASSNMDAIPRLWMARFGRTVADQVIEAVEGRLQAAPRPGVEASLAGERVGGAGKAENEDARTALAERAEARSRLEAMSRWLKDENEEDDAQGFRSRAVSQQDLLTGSSFSMTIEAGAAGGGYALLWGRGAISRFDGREGDISLDGEVTSVMLGADWTGDVWTAGLLMAHSLGAGEYRSTSEGEIEGTLAGVYPYGRYAMSERLSLWGIAGYGEGSLMLTPKDGTPIETHMDLTMAAAGVRGEAVQAPAEGGPALAVTSDVMIVQMGSEAARGSGGSLAPTAAEVTRLRLGLQGTWHGLEVGGGVLTPRLEAALRHDGGDAETGFGLDHGGGLAWSSRARDITVEVSGHGLLTHETNGFSERGLAGSLTWDPRPDTERGVTLSLRQTVGAQTTGGMDALLGSGALAGLAANDDGDELDRRRFEAKLGYGLAVFGGRFMGTPEIGLGLSDAHRDYSLGWRLGLARSERVSFALVLEGTRREAVNDDRPPEHELRLRLRARR